MERRHIIVSGKVQGVCFRLYTEQEANRLGLKGYVRNCADRTVEIVAEGEPEALLSLEKWAHQGSPSARVSQVKVNNLPATGKFSRFSMRY